MHYQELTKMGAIFASMSFLFITIFGRDTSLSLEISYLEKAGEWIGQNIVTTKVTQRMRSIVQTSLVMIILKL